MTDRNNHYVPQKRQYGTESSLVPLTEKDINATVLVAENVYGTVVPVQRGVAWDLPDELNRDPDSQRWINYSDEIGPHWSSFKGHDILVDVDIRQENHREVNSWKGVDEVRGSTVAKVLFNGQQVWESRARNVPSLLLNLHSEIQELLDHMQLVWHITHTEDDRQARFGLIGRAVYYRNHPGRITTFIGAQGCVVIEPEPGPWPAVPWRSTEDEYERAEPVKDLILSPHIWWWRDE